MRIPHCSPATCETDRKPWAGKTPAGLEQPIPPLGKRAPNARAALNLLYRKPIITATELGQALPVSGPTAQILIKDLQKLGILVEVSGQERGRVYVFERYLSLFLS